jgi:hypothetical protein
MAAHLMTARLIFGGMRSILDQALRIAEAKLKEQIQKVMEADASKVLKVRKGVFVALDQVFDIWDEDQLEKDKERQIRKESLDARRDLYRTALAQRRNKRRTRRVLSRHATPKQRRANTRWKNHPKSRVALPT